MPVFRERMSLHSIAAKFNPDINPLDPAESALSNLEIAWSNDVLRDEVVISSVPHRRALMNFEFGDLPQEIGMTLGQLFGVAAVDQITLLTSANRNLTEANTDLVALVQEKDQQIADLMQQLAGLQGVIANYESEALSRVAELVNGGGENATGT